MTAWVYARDIARGRDRDVAPALLAFAAPPFDADRAAGLGLTEAFAGLAPQLAEEVAAAAGAYLPGRHAVHLDGEAREAHLWEETGGYPVVPLAAPGRLDNASPFFSQIALVGAQPEADEAPPASDDGLAEVWELLARDAGADVVICTALGWPASGMAGDALTGLSWAWLVAGTPRVIVNRWLVPPASRGPFAGALHAALAARIPRSGPADALHLGPFDDQTRRAAPGLHPSGSFSLQHAGRTAFTLGQLDPRVADLWELPRETYVAEIDLASLLAVAVRPRAVVPVRYPAARRDIAFVVAEDVPWADVQREIARPPARGTRGAPASRHAMTPPPRLRVSLWPIRESAAAYRVDFSPTGQTSRTLRLVPNGTPPRISSPNSSSAMLIDPSMCRAR